MLAHPELISTRAAAVARAIESMRVDLAGPLSLAYLARAGRYSPFHFHRIFREVTGLTPARFLAGLRMAQARRLLVHSSATVSEVGQRVGYVSLGTFTTQFGRLVGLAPHRFRQLMRALSGVTVGSLLTGKLVPATLVPATLTPPAPAPASRCTLVLAGEAPRPALMVAGLWPVGSLGDGPGWCAIAGGGGQIRLPYQPGSYSAAVLGVPSQARLTDVLVDEIPSSFLIGLTRAGLPRAGAPVAVPVVLRRPLATDPPVLASAPLVRWLADRTHRAHPDLGVARPDHAGTTYYRRPRTRAAALP